MKRGFTLIEMLVVVGIILALAGASVAAFNKIARKGQVARGNELVSNVATALTAIYQESGRWPKAIIEANGNDEYRLGAEPGAVLARKGVMALSCNTNSAGKYVLAGLDRLGIVDPWAQAVIKRNKNASLDDKVPTGGRIRDHILRFAVDTDGLGFVQATVCGESIKVRAPAIVWGTGPDGKFGSFDEIGRTDDVFSFRIGQVVR